MGFAGFIFAASLFWRHSAFLHQLFSESGGASWSRVGSFMALVGCLSWDSCFVYWTHTLPLPANLESQAVFIGTLYGIGKVNQYVQSFKQNNPPTAGQ